MAGTHGRRGRERVEAHAVVAHPHAIGVLTALQRDRDVVADACRTTFESNSLVQRSTARSFGPGSPSVTSSWSANPARSAAARAACPIAAASPACSSR